MGTRRYYRCESPEILAVFDGVKEQLDHLQEAGSEIAKKVANLTGQPCKPIFGVTSSEYSFSGVKFESFTDELKVNFTVPQKSRGFVSSPRAKADSDIKALFAERIVVDRGPAWEAIGTSWDELLFNAMGFFHVKGDSLYVESSLDLTARLTEITGGEYQAAKEAVEGLEE